MKKEKNLRKWVIYLLMSVNLLILCTITNNSFLTDFVLALILGINTLLIFKYDHKYINIGDDYIE